jgi:hypothetical protein
MQPILTAYSFKHISGQLQVRFANAGLSDAVKTADLSVSVIKKHNNTEGTFQI